MNQEEKFKKIRECIAFGSAQSPYVLTDAEEIELYDFLDELEDSRIALNGFAAEVWDKGYDAGLSHEGMRAFDPNWPERTPNPYRQETP